MISRQSVDHEFLKFCLKISTEKSVTVPAKFAAPLSLFEKHTERFKLKDEETYRLSNVEETN